MMLPQLINRMHTFVDHRAQRGRLRGLAVDGREFCQFHEWVVEDGVSSLLLVGPQRLGVDRERLRASKRKHLQRM
jgi:hypothetical protein